MKYYYDTEFLEGTQIKRFLGLPIANTNPTIDLISIGIVSEDNREYYAISKDFNLKEAWNRYQMKQVYGDARNTFPSGVKEYWIRENVLKPIWLELYKTECKILNSQYIYEQQLDGIRSKAMFNYKSLKYLINKYGKTNKQIAEEIKDFINPPLNTNNDIELLHNRKVNIYGHIIAQPTFYGYYSAYDHVALCWLFGKMIDLPSGFPMYTIDLKQMIDDYCERYNKTKKSKNKTFIHVSHKLLKNNIKYPKESNEHNALADARWNKQLHEFLQNLKHEKTTHRP